MIERLYIQNFRCLESVTFDFAGKPSALIIGKNWAGKSTTLKALTVFQRICRGSSRVDKLFSVSDFTFSNTDRPMRFEIEVSLSGKHYAYAISFDWPAHFREARILDESLSVDSQPVFSRQQAQIQLSNGSSFGLNWHVFALPVIDEKPPERAIRDFKAFLGALIVTAPIPANMSGFSDQPSSQLEEDASNFASCLRGLLETEFAVYAEFDAYIRSFIPDFSSIKNIDRGKDGKQLMVSFKSLDAKESLTVEVEFDALSDGEKCFFLSGYLIASGAAGLPIVCMWDEPDNHLSLSQVGQFITSLRKMAQRGAQFIATTHHPETVRKFSDDSTIVLTRKSHLDPTRARLLNEFSYSGDLVHALIRDEIIG